MRSSSRASKSRGRAAKPPRSKLSTFLVTTQRRIVPMASLPVRSLERGGRRETASHASATRLFEVQYTTIPAGNE
jgi:hypothetical protein